LLGGRGVGDAKRARRRAMAVAVLLRPPGLNTAFLRMITVDMVAIGGGYCITPGVVRPVKWAHTCGLGVTKPMGLGSIVALTAAGDCTAYVTCTAV